MKHNAARTDCSRAETYAKLGDGLSRVRSAEGAAPGTIVHASAIEGLHVACGEGTAIELVDIQLEGKRVMSARDAMASKALVAGARFSRP